MSIREEHGHGGSGYAPAMRLDNRASRDHDDASLAAVDVASAVIVGGRDATDPQLAELARTSLVVAHPVDLVVRLAELTRVVFDELAEVSGFDRAKLYDDMVDRFLGRDPGSGGSGLGRLAQP